ncbi:DUF1002 domain-containing protein [Clostridium sp.]|uniref:DUF1002 domain-containing protein n=1 Tax=Clostridium sp. TaxID=1506 RepID=UPI002638D744|nr:DUF1002 domain-containing protein [Clostridium sp.]
MKKNLIKIIFTSIIVINLSTINTFAIEKGRVTFGVDLTDSQEIQMLKDFDVSENDVTIDTITNEDIINQLGLDPNDKSNYEGGCYSSSYVKLTTKGGVKVESYNLTEVTSLMLSNALVTSGVTDANIIAGSPFPVTGTSALSGILKGFEKAKGEELSLKNKKTAQEEIETTSSLGDEIGQDEAAKVINDIKTKVIKESPKNEEEIKNIINDLLKDYDFQLSEDQKTKINNLMININDLNIDYSVVKDTLKNVSSQISDALKESGSALKESGFFQKLVDSILDFLSGIFSSLKESN